MTIDVQANIGRHQTFGYQIAFPDGRPSFWDSSETRTDWWAYRDPGEMWTRTFYQMGALHDKEITTALEVAKNDDLYAGFAPEWVEFLRDELEAIALAEYGLSMPMAHALRPALGDAAANCVSFNGGFKLRHAQTLALYGMELDEAIGEFPIQRGKRSFLEESAWQPTRRYLERLEAVHDWVEIIVATNVVFEPLVGVLLRREVLMGAASANGDLVTPTYGQAAQAEWAWARAWSTAFVAQLVGDAEHGEANRGVLSRWLADWVPQAREAADALSAWFERVPNVDFADARTRVEQDFVGVIREAELESVGAEVLTQ